jgi:GDP-L-fucose synthase
MSQGYREQYGFNSTVLYPVNLYVGRATTRRPSHEPRHPGDARKFHEAKQRGDSVVLWGDRIADTRVLHVEDCAERPPAVPRDTTRASR